VRNGLLGRHDHPVLGPVPFVRHPLRIQDMETPMRLAPTLGEHTEEILRSAGCATDGLQRLREAGAIR